RTTRAHRLRNSHLHARAGGHRRSHGRTAHQGSSRAGLSRSSSLLSARDPRSGRAPRRYDRGYCDLPNGSLARVCLGAQSRRLAGGRSRRVRHSTCLPHQFIQQLRGRLDEVEQHFGKGRVFAPIAGIVSTGLAHVGQSLTAGTPIAEILDPTNIFVDWYIPNERLIDPKVGQEVFVLFGNRRIPGKIAEILPVSAVYAGTQRQQLLTRDRPATQIARIRFDPGASPPPLNSTVYVHMHYTEFSAWVASVLVRVFGLY